nr:hypothetical protein [Deltaproteobacteria bacterium]
MHLALLPPGLSLAAIAVALGAVSWILGRWRDLSPAVAGLVASALALDD